MWVDIFEQNRENILDAIESFKKELEICQKMVEMEEWERLHRWMGKANTLLTFSSYLRK